MNLKILSILIVIFCVFSGLKIFAQPYEVAAKTGLSTDKNIVYIGVDKNRIIDDVGGAQQKNYKNYSANPPDESKYKIDIENWVEPKEVHRALSPRHDDIEFGRGLGVDKDIMQESDATNFGSIDARGAQHIREDTAY